MPRSILRLCWFILLCSQAQAQIFYERSIEENSNSLDYGLIPLRDSSWLFASLKGLGSDNDMQFTKLDRYGNRVKGSVMLGFSTDRLVSTDFIQDNSGQVVGIGKSDSWGPQFENGIVYALNQELAFAWGVTVSLGEQSELHSLTYDGDTLLFFGGQGGEQPTSAFAGCVSTNGNDQWAWELTMGGAELSLVDVSFFSDQVFVLLASASGKLILTKMTTEGNLDGSIALDFPELDLAGMKVFGDQLFVEGIGGGYAYLMAFNEDVSIAWAKSYEGIESGSLSHIQTSLTSVRCMWQLPSGAALMEFNSDGSVETATCLTCGSDNLIHHLAVSEVGFLAAGRTTIENNLSLYDYYLIGGESAEGPCLGSEVTILTAELSQQIDDVTIVAQAKPIFDSFSTVSQSFYQNNRIFCQRDVPELSIEVSSLQFCPNDTLVLSNSYYQQVTWELNGESLGTAISLELSIDSASWIKATHTFGYTDSIFLEPQLNGCEDDPQPENSGSPVSNMFISPNNDGVNDFLKFSKNLADGEIISLRIFDDLGHQIYFSEIYEGDWPLEPVPTGHYFFQIQSAQRDEYGVLFVQNE